MDEARREVLAQVIEGMAMALDTLADEVAMGARASSEAHDFLPFEIATMEGHNLVRGLKEYATHVRDGDFSERTVWRG